MYDNTHMFPCLPKLYTPNIYKILIVILSPEELIFTLEYARYGCIITKSQEVYLQAKHPETLVIAEGRSQ